jgi:hypothetical protein
MSEFFPLIEDAYYKVPVGTVIFRGDTNAYVNKNTVILTKDTYFGHTSKIANIYGVPASYATTRELHLLALDVAENYEVLNGIDDEQFKNALRRSFRGGKARDSDAKYDKIVANKICELGYDGYATNEMFEAGFEDDDIAESKFHAELMICNAEEIAIFKQFMDQNVEQVINQKRKHLQLVDARIRKRPSGRGIHLPALDIT